MASVGVVGLLLMSSACFPQGSAFRAPCPVGLSDEAGAVAVSLQPNSTMPFVFWQEAASTFGVEACGVVPGSYHLLATAGGQTLEEQLIKVHGNSITVVQLPPPTPMARAVASFVLKPFSNRTMTYARNPCGNQDACLCDTFAKCASEQEWRHTCTCVSGYGGNGTSCNACQPGSWKAEEENAPCDQCDAGTFSNVSAALECQTCPANTFSPAVSGRALAHMCASISTLMLS